MVSLQQCGEDESYVAEGLAHPNTNNRVRSWISGMRVTPAKPLSDQRLPVRKIKDKSQPNLSVNVRYE